MSKKIKNPSINILYLHAHDAGRWVQPYGVPVETPHLMRFAKQSVLFRKAFSAAPTCGPSRAALLSGQYPHQVGMFGLPGQGWIFDDYNKHLVHFLNRLGYETVLAGVQHEAHHADMSPLGYQRDLNAGFREASGQFYPETIDHVERFFAEKQRGQDRPFFISVGIDEPHRNNRARPEMNIDDKSALFSKTRYYDPEKLDWRYTAPPPWLPDLPEVRQDMRSYAEGVNIMDEYMGRVLYALEQYGLAENTLVILTTDHGIEFPGSKKTLSDQGTGVMLMLRGPGGLSGGKVIEPLVSQLDIYPTVCEILDAEKPAWLEGKSLLPLITGDAEKLHDEIFTEQTYHEPLNPLRAIRTERYKLVLRHPETGPLLRHDGPLKEIMEEIGWYENREAAELFDLYLDPQEACNRIHDPALAEIRRDLEHRLSQWMGKTGDCFPSGKFPEIKECAQ
ncbi:MAG: sulfatase [Kiritimatiellales bacterium]